MPSDIIFIPFKGILHPKMKTLSPVYSLSCYSKSDFFWLLWTTKEDVRHHVRYWQLQSAFTFTALYFSYDESDCGCHSATHPLLCFSDESQSYGFGTTWGWINDRIFILEWRIHLMPSRLYSTTPKCAHFVAWVYTLVCR